MDSQLNRQSNGTVLHFVKEKDVVPALPANRRWQPICVPVSMRKLRIGTRQEANSLFAIRESWKQELGFLNIAVKRV
jgi:hypothetical protein